MNKTNVTAKSTKTITRTILKEGYRELEEIQTDVRTTTFDNGLVISFTNYDYPNGYLGLITIDYDSRFVRYTLQRSGVTLSGDIEINNIERKEEEVENILSSIIKNIKILDDRYWL